MISEFTPSDLINKCLIIINDNFDFKVKMRILMGTYALSAGYYDAYYKRAQQVSRIFKCSQ